MNIESEIQDKALSLGFDLCGIAQVRRLTVDRERFDRWIASGYQSTLGYMCRNTDKRFDPSLLFPGARSVIVCAASYNRGPEPASAAVAGPAGTGKTEVTGTDTARPEKTKPGGHCADYPGNESRTEAVTLLERTVIPSHSAEITGMASTWQRSRPRIASYALTRDYHLLIRERLHELCEFIRSLVPSFEGRPFVDTAPLLEKRWAVEAGLGWIGRNSLLVNRRYGSMLMLGEIVTSLELTTTPAGTGQTLRCMNTNEYATSPEVTDDMATSHHPHDFGLAELCSSGQSKASGGLPDGDSMCGSCRRCIEACPNGAIVSPRVIDTRRCISRMTVESKYTAKEVSGTGNSSTPHPITVTGHQPVQRYGHALAQGNLTAGDTIAAPEKNCTNPEPPVSSFNDTEPYEGIREIQPPYTGLVTDKAKYVSHERQGPQTQQEHIPVQTDTLHRLPLHGWIFGCDECQLCCPYNIKAEVSPCNIFTSRKPFTPPTAGEWLAMSAEEFDSRFGDTPLSRCGLAHIQRTIRDNTGK